MNESVYIIFLDRFAVPSYVGMTAVQNANRKSVAIKTSGKECLFFR